MDITDFTAEMRSLATAEMISDWFSEHWQTILMHNDPTTKDSRYGEYQMKRFVLNLVREEYIRSFQFTPLDVKTNGLRLGKAHQGWTGAFRVSYRGMCCHPSALFSNTGINIMTRSFDTYTGDWASITYHVLMFEQDFEGLRVMHALSA